MHSRTSLRITGAQLEMLEFGLALTGLATLAMFSALMVIITACEALKRIFRETEIETAPAEGSVGDPTSDGNGVSTST